MSQNDRDRIVNYGDFILGDEEDENKVRGNWTGKLDFQLSVIGFVVGLGNVWRFPYKAAAGGGASFLIPYVITLVTAGLPMFFLEMAFGQFASQGPISLWNAVPLFKGLGYSMVVLSALVCIYYNMIIAYTMYYLFASFASELPWAHCTEEWIQKYCCRERIVEGPTVLNQTMLDMIQGNCSGRTPSEIFWSHTVLDISDSAEEGSSELRWQLVLCLMLSWIIVFLSLSKGIKSSGKVVYVTATFPYVVLLILLIRNCVLDGAIDGIKFYVIPDFERLKDGKVWYSAASQIFYSLGIAFGGLETMASYNRFHNNIHKDAVMIAVINCATSIFAGFVIFSVIGYMAKKAGVDVEEMANQGPGLAFIAYPEGIASMPVSQLWSILFFVMLVTLGLDSQFAMMETVISAIVDEFPVLRTRKRKLLFTGLVCALLFLLGLPQCARNGIYIVTLFEWYSANFNLMVVSLLVILVIVWIYGWKRFCEDIEMMLGHKPNMYWIASWLFITPAMLFFILIFSIVQHAPVSYISYIGTYEYPSWVDGMGWMMVTLSLLFIPLIAMIEYCRAHGFLETIKKTVAPTASWGPMVPEYRTGFYTNKPLPHHNGMLNDAYIHPSMVSRINVNDLNS